MSVLNKLARGGLGPLNRPRPIPAAWLRWRRPELVPHCPDGRPIDPRQNERAMLAQASVELVVGVLAVGRRPALKIGQIVRDAAFGEPKVWR